MLVFLSLKGPFDIRTFIKWIWHLDKKNDFGIHYHNKYVNHQKVAVYYVSKIKMICLWDPLTKMCGPNTTMITISSIACTKGHIMSPHSMLLLWCRFHQMMVKTFLLVMPSCMRLHASDLAHFGMTRKLRSFSIVWMLKTLLFCVSNNWKLQNSMLLNSKSLWIKPKHIPW